MTAQHSPENITKPITGLSPRNPLDYLRLVSWVFTDPIRLKAYRKHAGEASVRRMAVLPITLMLWLPFAIPMIAAASGRLPKAESIAPGILIMSLLLGITATIFLAGKGDTPFEPKERSTIESVFSVMLGFAISGAYLAALGIFGARAPALMIISTIVAFGASIGVSTTAADELALGGSFIIACLLALTVVTASAYGGGWVVPFGGALLGTFLLSFIVAFVAGPLLNMIEKATKIGAQNRKVLGSLTLASYVLGVLIIAVMFLIRRW